jgi:caffeic acid 3-O-methyltransferase
MASDTTIDLSVLVREYEGFKDIKTLVDVGGGIGKTLETIISSYPHIHGINYDLPHVITDAPTIPGIEHVAGSMFESVPSGDTIFMKRIMHDWSDENCLKILNNCQKALPEKGKVLIHDCVLQPSGGLPQIFDMLMMAHCDGGMERTEEQWRKLLTTAGFSTINFIELLQEQWLIEAFK